MWKYVKKLCLIIIDGFGVAPPGPGNARLLAKMPTIERMEKEVPNVIMAASGNAAGLPKGQQGASEPGHLVMGAGRIVWQPLEEINLAIRSKKFFENPVLVSACDRAREKKVPLHLFNIFSFGGVHGHIDHLFAMMDLAKERGVEEVILHLVGDGRDVPKQQFSKDYDVLCKKLKEMPFAKVASLVGRYYAMDRDRQYADRTQLSYRLLAEGEGEEVEDLCDGVKRWYDSAPEDQKTDYYIRPLKTKEFQPVRPGDVFVDLNFRSDRQIQIVSALNNETFEEFPRPIRIEDVVCMGPYSDHLSVAYPATPVPNTLGEVVSKAGLKQLRIAETDKIAHVTFFFNGQRHETYPGEDVIKIESPKVPNFAEAPAMSASELTDALIGKVGTNTYDFIVANYANPDLVGHGGVLSAEILACEAVDLSLARLLPALEANGYDWIVTSDHGNAEEKFLPGTTVVSPSHTSNPVQTFVHSSLIASSDQLKQCTGIKDIAPLCLKILGLPVPVEMR